MHSFFKSVCFCPQVYSSAVHQWNIIIPPQIFHAIFLWTLRRQYGKTSGTLSVSYLSVGWFVRPGPVNAVTYIRRTADWELFSEMKEKETILTPPANHSHSRCSFLLADFTLAQVQTIEESKNRVIEKGKLHFSLKGKIVLMWCWQQIRQDYFNEFAVLLQYSFVCSHSEKV